MRYPLIILAASLVVLFTGLGATRFWDHDEGYFAGAAAEMHARGDWVVPHFNDEMFGHKPPWMYWMMMVGYSLFGVGEWGARFFSAVFGTATALLTYRWGARLMNPRVGLYAGLAMISCVMFSVVSRAATPDSYLVFFSTLALYIFATHGFARGKREGDADDSNSVENHLPRSWWSFALMYAVMGLGVLVKGPIGVVLPMAVIGMYLLCTTPRRELPAAASRWERMQEAWRPFGPRNFFRTVWMMRPLTAIAMVLLVAGPWYMAAGLRTDGAFLEEFFIVHHLQRATSAMDGHSGPIFYYLPAVWAGLFPWSIFAVPALILWVRHLYKGDTCPRVLLFFSCWVGVYIGVFSLASTKLPNYVLPAYPALAVMIGYFIDSWIRNPDQVQRRWLRGALATPILIGLAVVVLFPASGLCDFGGGTLLDQNNVPQAVQRDIVMLGLVGLPLLLVGVAALVLAERGHIKASAASVCGMAILTMVCVWTYAAPRVSRFQAPQRMAQWLRDQTAGRPYRVAQYRFFRPTMVYYSDHPIESRRTPAEIREFVSTDEPVYVITDDYQMQWLQYILPADFEVVRRVSQFPEDGEILLLSRRANAVAAELPDALARTTASDPR